MRKYLIICYSVHEQRVASCNVFNTEDEALDFMEKDAENTYDEELANSGMDESCISLDIDGEYAQVCSCDEYTWTWEILEVDI